MKIGIYAEIEYGKPGGIQQYIERITKALVTYSNEKIYVITNKKFYNNFFHDLETNNNIKCFICNNDEFEIRELVKSIHLDVLHFPYQVFPYYYWDLPTVISLHDLQQEYFPEFFSKEEMNYRNQHFRKSAHMCDQIIVSFNHVKNDIVKFYSINNDKITVVTPGIEKNDKNFVNNISIKEKFGISKDFILYPAQTWKHKNHIRLLKALDILVHKHKNDIQLVCTGRKNEYFEKIDEYVTENKLDNYVKFLDFVSTEDLYSLYKSTELVVIPTLYEAGSFPLFEAISLGVPVICSNVTSLPETINNKKFIFDPYNEEEIALLLNEMLTNDSLINENIENCKNQIERFNWEKPVQDLINGYKCAINNFETYNKYILMFENRFKYEWEYHEALNKVNLIIDNIPSDKSLVIYAAGVHTKHLITKTNITTKNINCIVDKSHNNFKFMGYDVKEVEFIRTLTPEIIVISSFSYQNSIESYLIEEMNYTGLIIKLYSNEDYPFYYKSM